MLSPASIFLDTDVRIVGLDIRPGATLLVTGASGTVRGYLLLSDGDIGAVTADTVVSVGVPVETSFFSYQFVQ